MGGAYKLSAFVIRRKNTGDGDKVLTVFSGQKGKVRLLARGIRKVISRRAPHLELFCQTELVVHKGSGMDTITDAVSVQTAEHAHLSYTKLASLYFISELIDRMLPENEKHENIYLLVSQTIAAVYSARRGETKEIILCFIEKLLTYTGYRSPDSPRKSFDEYVALIDSIVERKIRTPKIFRRMQQ